MHVFGLWVEAGEHGESPGRHRGNVQTSLQVQIYYHSNFFLLTDLQPNLNFSDDFIVLILLDQQFKH